MGRVRAISFDLWDTVIADDSDEEKRRDQGLPSKRIERRNLVYSALSRHAPLDRALVDCAYDTADAAFREVWHNQYLTWPVSVRLKVVLAGLRRELPDDEFCELVRLHEEMELRVRPHLVPGAVEALRALSERYTLVVASDAIFSPGRALRQLLEGHGVLAFFSGFVFSDEAGCSKPSPEMFRRAAELAGCRVDELVHIGDREHNDIAGAKDAGAMAVLFTAAVNRSDGPTRADAVCRSFTQLPEIIDLLDRPDHAIHASISDH